jgi:deazaflavin-dependent oxidoreductase (nitroreductase family)
MKVVICGAGIAGLALAQRLATRGWDVVVLEKGPGPRAQGYMIDFFGAGYAAAEAMGVLPRLDELGYRMQEVRFVDSTGRCRARLGYTRFARAVGNQLLSIMRPDLELALRESLSESVELRYGTSLTGVDNSAEGVRVTLDDGEVVTADLLVGADGIHSAVRELVFGEERDYVRYLGFHTAAFTFRDPAVHAQVRESVHLTDSLDREVGLYGLRDGRVAAFTVHRSADPALPQDPRAALREEYDSLGWVVPAVLAQCPPADQVYYDQVAQIEMPRWHRGRVVLLGDACYAVSLLAGHGASLAVAGAYMLAEHLDSGSIDTASIEAALDRYERQWRPIVEEKQLVGRKAIRWFLPHTPTQLRIRHITLALSQVPGINRLIASSLAGKPTTIISRSPHFPLSHAVAAGGARLLRSRTLMRAPLWIYRAGLGFLFGSRMLMLEHIGRKTGLPRQVVLEVMDHPTANTYVVPSGFGDRSQWFRNVQANPRVRVHVSGRWPVPATARVLGREEADRALSAYRRRHPRAWASFKSVVEETLGSRIHDTNTELPMVELLLDTARP